MACRAATSRQKISCIAPLGRRFAILFNVSLVRRQFGDRIIHPGLDAFEEPGQLLIAHHVGDLVKLLRHNALPEHDLHPGVLLEQVFPHPVDPGRFPEQAHAIGQSIRNIEIPAVTPERCVLPVRQFVMQNDEVPDVLDLELAVLVVLIDIRLLDSFVREQLHQPNHALLNQVDAGGLQRFDEAAGQTQRDDVPVPVLQAPAGYEFQQARFPQVSPDDVLQQMIPGLVFAHVLAAENQAVAHAMLQWNAPLPTG